MKSEHDMTVDGPKEEKPPEWLTDLLRLIDEIGVARFSSRIGAGLVDEIKGYKAIEEFVKSDEERPLMSKLGQALLRRPNSYEKQ